ncbi:ATP-dependent Clp protease proteolytic subunit-related protein 2, chloroplastic-like [Carex rostrata]
MALSLTLPNSSCLYARTTTTCRSRHTDWPGCFRTGERNVNTSFYKEVQKKLSWRSKGTATQALATTMYSGGPRVFYRNKAEGISGFMGLWDALHKERIIFISDELNEETSNELVATLLYLDGLKSSKDFSFFINCRGGDISPSLAIYDTMQNLRNSVSTRCIGSAYDISAFILAAGKKGKRTCLPHSKVILRSPVGEASGKADVVLNETKELIKVRDHLYNKLAKHTGQPVEKIFDDLNDSKIFNPQQAIEYGLIDSITRPTLLSTTIGRKDKTAPGLG